MTAATQTTSTRVLVISDTHDAELEGSWRFSGNFDLAIHCGDLTQGSEIAEFHRAITLLQQIPASLKIVIAGNHDLTLHDESYLAQLAEAGISADDPAAIKTYGELGQATALLESEADNHILLLHEGVHEIHLPNGASLTVYASPWTPQRESSVRSKSEAGWAFQYPRADGHDFNIPAGIDIVATHGPPHGVLDRVDGSRAGCADLFAAVAKAKPKLHCFGHVHPGWGARLVTWKDKFPDQLSHFTTIDNENSPILERLAKYSPTRFDSEEERQEKQERYQEMRRLGFAEVDVVLEENQQTLFVNAAFEGDSEDVPVQPPMALTLHLSRTNS